MVGNGDDGIRSGAIPRQAEPSPPRPARLPRGGPERREPEDLRVRLRRRRVCVLGRAGKHGPRSPLLPAVRFVAYRQGGHIRRLDHGGLCSRWRPARVLLPVLCWWQDAADPRQHRGSVLQRRRRRAADPDARRHRRHRADQWKRRQDRLQPRNLRDRHDLDGGIRGVRASLGQRAGPLRKSDPLLYLRRVPCRAPALRPRLGHSVPSGGPLGDLRVALWHAARAVENDGPTPRAGGSTDDPVGSASA